ncbi:leukocyte antigen CD37 [Hoplias malabaricus]|uniref:leukocyte antigen CD37 n=1 Tax=Hoplias malabaricus TaxID=27720 RepID=UPI00346314F1
MASELCLSFTKYFLFVFNLVFFFLGSALLSLGLWIMFGETIFPISAPPFLSLTLFSYLLIGSGALTISLGFFGCLGALKEVKCMLAMYFILLTVLLVGQIIGGVLLITQRTAIQIALGSHVKNIIQGFGKNDSSLKDFEQTVTDLQHRAKCCGWSGPNDYNKIPCSCYFTVNITANATASEECPCECPSNSTYKQYSQGCKGPVETWIYEHILIILMIVFGLAVVEICGTILSMCLYKQSSVDYAFTLYH